MDKQLIDAINTDLSKDEFLVIVCRSFDETSIADNKNITIKKIPKSLLKNCEYDVDDYKLNIINPPVYEEGGLRCLIKNYIQNIQLIQLII